MSPELKSQLVIGFCAFVVIASMFWCVYDTWKTWRPRKRKRQDGPKGSLNKQQQLHAQHRAASTNNVIRFPR